MKLTCSKCKIEKGVEEFYKSKSRARGYSYKCKVCVKEYMKEYMKEYYQRPERKEYRKEYMKEYQQRPEVKEYMKEYRKEYQQKPERKEYRKEYQQKPEVKAQKNARQRRRRRNDPRWAVGTNLRNRTNRAIVAGGGERTCSSEKYFGMPVQAVHEYIGMMFTEGISWENYGEWEIDHIIPISSFDLRDEEQRYQAFHYSNLQPLWATDNRSKGAKLDWGKNN